MTHTKNIKRNTGIGAGIPSLLAVLLITPITAFGQVTAPLGGGDGRPAATATIAPGSASGSEVAISDDYRLDTGDVISVEVLRHGDVSRTLKLPADAQVRLPRLTDPIPARGKTCPELAKEVTERLVREGKLRLNPNQVSVSVTEMRIRRVYVRGTAGRNGDFDLRNGWRVSELVTVAGGIQNPERVTAQLSNPKRAGSEKIDISAALTQPTSAANVTLQEGDTLSLDLPRNKRLFVKGEGPRGMHELDERFGLRQGLTQLGFSINNASGDLRNSKLYRHTVPGDPNSPVTPTTVDLFALMSDDKSSDIALEDLDTLEISPSQRFVYIFGETGGPRKWYMPEDKKVYLADIMAMSATGSTKLNDIRVMRPKADNNGLTTASYKFGDYLKDGNAKNNPEVLPKDMIVMNYVTRSDETIGKVWQVWGLYGIAASLFPSIRLR
jgi:protein involved in polysaccharide export with SLBB domain